MTDDNTGDLDTLRIDRQLRDRGGAKVEMRDARVTRAFEFLQPIVTGGVLAGIIYFANQVGQLRDAVIETNKQIALSNLQNTRLTEDVKDHEGRIRALEGRGFRGGAPKDLQEPQRVR